MDEVKSTDIVSLHRVVQARSGDKGNAVDITVFSPNEAVYEALKTGLTAEVVHAHFGNYVLGDVTRYEIPNFMALKFLCTRALGGGGASSLRSDNLGKSMSANLLRIKLPMPIEAARSSPIFNGPEGAADAIR